MSTVTQTSTGSVGMSHRISPALIDANFVAVAVFSALGLLASFYFVSHFPPSVEDATFFASLL